MSEHRESTAPAQAKSVWRRAYDRWMRIAHVIGVFNTRVIMSLLYFLIVLPMGLVFRMVSDPLQLKEPKDTNWVPLPSPDHKLESARQQF